MSEAPIYLMGNGQKCWVINPDVLNNYGGWATVRVVPDGALDNIPVGPDVTQ
jgi:hypothetical protein